MSTVPHVYTAIGEVQAALAATGIAKGRQNQQQGYKFRGIDEVYNVIAPVLPKHGLCIIPRVLSRTEDERQSRGGGALYSVKVDMEFDFVSAKDGSVHTARTSGEAMDSADKATNKAMSAAHKYVIFMTFTVPTEGDNDADEQTPEPAARKGAPSIVKQPAGTSAAKAAPAAATGKPASAAGDVLHREEQILRVREDADNGRTLLYAATRLYVMAGQLKDGAGNVVSKPCMADVSFSEVGKQHKEGNDLYDVCKVQAITVKDSGVPAIEGAAA